MMLAIFWAAGLHGQACALTIEGQVLSVDDQEPLPFATVQVKGMDIGTTADSDGYFKLTDLCPGTYTLVSTRVDCNHEEHLVHLHGDSVLYFFLEASTINLEEIVVKSQRATPNPMQSVVQLTGEELETGKGLNLAESLRRLPGVTTLNTGATIAKPVIQGLHSNRVLILNNGVRLEGQQWGLEHAPTVDPFSAEQIKVIKGAGSVRYGAEALGGVILIDPPALPASAGIGGMVQSQAFSNGRTGALSGQIEGKLNGKWPIAARLQGTLKRGGNLRTPDYFLDNTGISEQNLSWNLGLEKGRFDTEVFYSLFQTEIGILSDAHIGNLSDLEDAIERGRPLEDGSFSYDINRPMQRVLHEIIKAGTSYSLEDAGKLHFTYARQYNRRQEFDAHRAYGSPPEALDDPDIQFELTTHETEARWEHRPIGKVRGSLGAVASWQRNSTDRGALIPNYRRNTAGVYLIERWQNYPSPWEFEAGLRYDYQWMDVQSQGTDTLDQALRFNSLSAAVGAKYRFPEWLDLQLHFGTAWRPPHVNELYSNGVHHGSASFEKGNPDLSPERAYNTSLTANLNRGNKLNGSLTLYYNLIDDFIYAEPLPDPVLTIRGAFPAFEYNQADARIMGFDWGLSYTLMPRLDLESRGSLLRSWNREEEDYIIYMPPDQFQTSLKYDIPLPALSGDGEDALPFVRLTMVNVLRQTRAPEGVDYAPPPDGHTRFRLEAGATLHWGRQPFELGLGIFNLFNTRYREYLNRFRYFAEEPGRNISLRLRVPFSQ